MTSQNSDHCEHCDRPSCRWVSEGLAELHRDHNGAEWAGICPACAERERIVWFLDDLADRADDDGLLGRRDTITKIKHQLQDGEHCHD